MSDTHIMELMTLHGYCERIAVEGTTWRCPDDAHALLVEVKVDRRAAWPRLSKVSSAEAFTKFGSACRLKAHRGK